MATRDQLSHHVDDSVARVPSPNSAGLLPSSAHPNALPPPSFLRASATPWCGSSSNACDDDDDDDHSCDGVALMGVGNEASAWEGSPPCMAGAQQCPNGAAAAPSVSLLVAANSPLADADASVLEDSGSTTFGGPTQDLQSGEALQQPQQQLLQHGMGNTNNNDKRNTPTFTIVTARQGYHSNSARNLPPLSAYHDPYHPAPYLSHSGGGGHDVPVDEDGGDDMRAAHLAELQQQQQHFMDQSTQPSAFQRKMARLFPSSSSSSSSMSSSPPLSTTPTASSTGTAANASDSASNSSSSVSIASSFTCTAANTPYLAHIPTPAKVKIVSLLSEACRFEIVKRRECFEQRVLVMKAVVEDLLRREEEAAFMAMSPSAGGDSLPSEESHGGNPRADGGSVGAQVDADPLSSAPSDAATVATNYEAMTVMQLVLAKMGGNCIYHQTQNHPNHPSSATANCSPNPPPLPSVHEVRSQALREFFVAFHNTTLQNLHGEAEDVSQCYNALVKECERTVRQLVNVSNAAAAERQLRQAAERQLRQAAERQLRQAAAASASSPPPSPPMNANNMNNPCVPHIPADFDLDYELQQFASHVAVLHTRFFPWRHGILFESDHVKGDSPLLDLADGNNTANNTATDIGGQSISSFRSDTETSTAGEGSDDDNDEEESGDQHQLQPQHAGAANVRTRAGHRQHRANIAQYQQLMASLKERGFVGHGRSSGLRELSSSATFHRSSPSSLVHRNAVASPLCAFGCGLVMPDYIDSIAMMTTSAASLLQPSNAAAGAGSQTALVAGGDGDGDCRNNFTQTCNQQRCGGAQPTLTALCVPPYFIARYMCNNSGNGNSDATPTTRDADSYNNNTTTTIADGQSNEASISISSSTVASQQQQQQQRNLLLLSFCAVNPISALKQAFRQQGLTRMLLRGNIAAAAAREGEAERRRVREAEAMFCLAAKEDEEEDLCDKDDGEEEAAAAAMDAEMAAHTAAVRRLLAMYGVSSSDDSAMPHEDEDGNYCAATTANDGEHQLQQQQQHELIVDGGLLPFGGSADAVATSSQHLTASSTQGRDGEGVVHHHHHQLMGFGFAAMAETEGVSLGDRPPSLSLSPSSSPPFRPHTEEDGQEGMGRSVATPLPLSALLVSPLVSPAVGPHYDEAASAYEGEGECVEAIGAASAAVEVPATAAGPRAMFASITEQYSHLTTYDHMNHHQHHHHVDPAKAYNGCCSSADGANSISGEQRQQQQQGDGPTNLVALCFADLGEMSTLELIPEEMAEEGGEGGRGGGRGDGAMPRPAGSPSPSAIEEEALATDTVAVAALSSPDATDAVAIMPSNSGNSNTACSISDMDTRLLLTAPSLAMAEPPSLLGHPRGATRIITNDPQPHYHNNNPIHIHVHNGSGNSVHSPPHGSSSSSSLGVLSGGQCSSPDTTCTYELSLSYPKVLDPSAFGGGAVSLPAMASGGLAVGGGGVVIRRPPQQQNEHHHDDGGGAITEEAGSPSLRGDLPIQFCDIEGADGSATSESIRGAGNSSSYSSGPMNSTQTTPAHGLSSIGMGGSGSGVAAVGCGGGGEGAADGTNSPTIVVVVVASCEESTSFGNAVDVALPMSSLGLQQHAVAEDGAHVAMLASSTVSPTSPPPHAHLLSLGATPPTLGSTLSSGRTASSISSDDGNEGDDEGRPYSPPLPGVLLMTCPPTTPPIPIAPSVNSAANDFLDGCLVDPSVVGGIAGRRRRCERQLLAGGVCTPTSLCSSPSSSSGCMASLSITISPQSVATSAPLRPPTLLDSSSSAARAAAAVTGGSTTSASDGSHSGATNEEEEEEEEGGSDTVAVAGSNSDRCHSDADVIPPPAAVSQNPTSSRTELCGVVCHPPPPPASAPCAACHPERLLGESLGGSLSDYI